MQCTNYAKSKYRLMLLLQKGKEKMDTRYVAQCWEGGALPSAAFTLLLSLSA